MKQKPSVDQKPIQGKIGRNFLKQIFGGKKFMGCLSELFKNSRDWQANLIIITTGPDKTCMKIVDNGCGMGAKNRDAYASINADDIARGPRQSGKFDTGSKFMLFSHADVVVLTAPEEEPDKVYCFELEPDSYSQKVLTSQSILSEILPKNKETWPYPFSYGTELTYKFRNPRSKSILRGQDLAAELSAILPLKLMKAITVDGLPLPEKKIVGEKFAVLAR
jgi:hypothetical protein